MSENDLELWRLAAEHLRGVLNTDVFSRWIEIIRPAFIKDNSLVLNVDNDFYQDWLEKNYKGLILDALLVVGAPVGMTVKFQVLEKEKGVAKPPPPHAAPGPKKAAPKKASGILASPLNPTFTFENFVTGPSNSFAHAAAIAAAQKPGGMYNPLFIHGQTGLGKTHLMQAVGLHVLRSPGMSVCYVTSETFVNEYIESLKNKSFVDFRNRYRRADVLLIDDVQFFCGKGSSQEEFFHTFNALETAHKQIIITSDLPPNDLKDLEPRLVSRFQKGMVMGIESPDFETRLAILHYKNSLAKVRLSNDILTFIAHNIKSNVRCLEGALTLTVAFASLNNNRNITDEMMRTLLKDQLNREQQKDITCDEVKRATISHFDLRMADMSSKERTQTLVMPRQVAMFLCRKLTRSSLSEIAQAFDKTHATVLHACKTIQSRIEVEPDLLSTIKQIVQSLGRDPSSINL